MSILPVVRPWTPITVDDLRPYERISAVRFVPGLESTRSQLDPAAGQNNPMSSRPPFVPERAFVQEEALSYEPARRVRRRLVELGVPVSVLPAGGRVRIGGAAQVATDPAETYRAAKRTLVVAARRTLSFQTCRPSADYQLPLVTSCPATCAYCYLQTTLGPRPYVRVYANTGEILERAARYASSGDQPTTSFEAAATGDPLAVEPLTGSLREAILFAAAHDRVLLRSVSKFPLPAELLDADHCGRTRLRWSVNTAEVIASWEPGTAPLERRIEAAAGAASAGYAVGFMVAPVFAARGWEDEYASLFETLRDCTAGAGFPRGADGKDLTFEVVTHRFTARAKRLILERHASSGLPLEEDERRYRRGQFGYGKYVYPPEVVGLVKAKFSELVATHFPGAVLEYVV